MMKKDPNFTALPIQTSSYDKSALLWYILTFFTKCSGFFFTRTEMWLSHEYVISAASPQMQEATELKDVVSLLPSLQNGM